MTRILIVDDEKWIRKGLAAAIDQARLGILAIDEAMDAPSAIRQFKEHRPEIVISDICMPGDDGCTLCETLLKLQPATRFIMISGYDDFKYAQRALRFGAVDYLLKPVDKNQLNTLLEKLLLPEHPPVPRPGIRDLVVLEAQDKETGNQTIIRQVLDYLSGHYREPVTLAELAEKYHVNANYLSTLFHETTGTTFSSHLTQIRIEHAMRLLRSTNLRIHSVARETGFADCRYFCRVFKKVTGLAPTEYSAENRTPSE